MTSSRNEVNIDYITGYVYIMRGEECVMMFTPDQVSICWIESNPPKAIYDVTFNDKYQCFQTNVVFTYEPR